MTAQQLELRNEFAAVRLEVDKMGNGPRLRITDVETGLEGYLDPFALQLLARLPAAGFDALVAGPLAMTTRRTDGGMR
jgi:hypothetical protein